MKKIILFSILLSFLIGCTNLSTKLLKFTPLEKLTLEKNITSFKSSLKDNNILEIVDFFEDTYRNKKALEILETINFSTISIFSSPVDFSGKTPTNILGFSYSGKTFYSSFTYSYKNNQWKISTFDSNYILPEIKGDINEK